MADTGTTVKATDTDALIKQWRASGKRVEQIAAELAAKIDAGRLHRWEELPPVSVLADEYGVSERTITSVKNSLAVHGFLTKENRRYYIA
jgi:DNA-binding GntR family transcriptional regulator